MKLMKLMLTNEKKANDMIKDKIKNYQTGNGVGSPKVAVSSRSTLKSL
jgi:hypothetical protein